MSKLDNFNGTDYSKITYTNTHSFLFPHPPQELEQHLVCGFKYVIPPWKRETQIQDTARKTRPPAKELSTFLKLYTVKTKGRFWAFVIRVLIIHMHLVVTWHCEPTSQHICYKLENVPFRENHTLLGYTMW